MLEAEHLPLSSESAGELDVLWLDSNTLGVDGLKSTEDESQYMEIRLKKTRRATHSQVGVFKERDEVSLGRLLESHDGRALESEIGLEVLGNLTDETLEGELSDEELGGLWAGESAKVPHPNSASRLTFWYRLISRRATVPGRYLCGFFTPPAAGADLRAALAASCFRGAFPPVDFRAVCLVRAIVLELGLCESWSAKREMRGRKGERERETQQPFYPPSSCMPPFRK